ncbi:NUDIX hydrolase [bacterium]|jgi:8-oxo-dGTP diphosphatase|nr:NUDIX hydrolase [bacterium]MBT6293199.1 NUDIX hydrolase [bacterium]
MNQEAFYRTSVKALIKNKEGKILLSKDGIDGYDFLGGGLDHGETLEEGLKREVLEETGLHVKKISYNPSYYMTFYSTLNSRWSAYILLECELEDLNLTPSSECIALEFFSPQEILDNPKCYEATKKVAKLMLQEK